MAASPRELTERLCSSSPQSDRRSICFVGMSNLPVLAREYNKHSIGGEQVQHTLLARALAKRGYRVSMVTADYGQVDGSVWDEITVYKAFAFAEGLPLLRFVHPRWSKLWSALKRADADVYYTSCAGSIVGQLAMFCTRFNRRFIFRAASDSDCKPSELLVQYWRDRKLYEYGLRHADGILTQSAHQQALLRKNYGLDSTVAGMLVQGSSERRNCEERDIPVLWVNNFRPLKRPEVYLEAARELSSLHFHVVGGAAPGNTAYFRQIREQAQQIANVSFHGQIAYHDVNDFYHRARVLVNTSEIEGFPNSYLQAWAHGTPVITFIDPDGIIEREGLGCVVKDKSELIARVQHLATDAKTWAQVSARCLAFMGREFADDRILEPYRQMFDSSSREAVR
jgi:glycosyltransferase involved in cell wall biosynthesis